MINYCLFDPRQTLIDSIKLLRWSDVPTVYKLLNDLSYERRVPHPLRLSESLQGLKQI